MASVDTRPQRSRSALDRVDLDALERELLGAVGDTMQPAHAAGWLRDMPR